MVHCCQCGRVFSSEGQGGWVASISGSIMGDEYSETYYFCGQCGVYTVCVCHDCFLNEEEVSTRSPISKEEGDQKVALIGKCAEPWNKKCRCEAHRSYFDDALD